MNDVSAVASTDAAVAGGRSAPLDVDVCVVGAGPHALAVVTHLVTARSSLRERIAVLDPSGRWMETWRSQFARLEIDVLRSPIVHHPGVDPLELAEYEAHERLPRSHLPYDPPITSTFDGFCSELITRSGLDDLPVAAHVVALRRSDGGDEPMTIITNVGTVRARHVVWAANSCEAIVPSPLVGAVDGSGPVDHGARLDLRSIDSMDKRHVVVVGGGLTAGHLVVGARARGATVTLLTRRPMVERSFDVEPGWLGPRHLAGYWRLRDPERRLQAAHRARGGGSMPSWMCRRLRAEIEQGQLEHIVGEVDHATVDDTGVQLDSVGRTITADRCWLATGSRPDVRADQALCAAVGRHVDGVPVVDSDLRVEGTGVFVTGRLATIELGPAAGNLWGARMAARRICRAITDIDLDLDTVATADPPARPRRTEGSR